MCFSQKEAFFLRWQACPFYQWMDLTKGKSLENLKWQPWQPWLFTIKSRGCPSEKKNSALAALRDAAVMA